MKTKTKDKKPVKINTGNPLTSWVIDHTGVLHYQCDPTYREPPGVLTTKEFNALKGYLRRKVVKGVVCWLNQESYSLYVGDTAKAFSQRQVLAMWLRQGRRFDDLEQLSKLSKQGLRRTLHKFQIELYQR